MFYKVKNRKSQFQKSHELWNCDQNFATQFFSVLFYNSDLDIVLFVEIQRNIGKFQAGYLSSQRRFRILAFETNNDDFLTTNGEKIGCINSRIVFFFDGKMGDLNIWIIRTAETLGNIIGDETDSQTEIVLSNIFPSLEQFLKIQVWVQWGWVSK